MDVTENNCLVAPDVNDSCTVVGKQKLHDWAALSMWTGTGIGYCQTNT